MESKKCLKISKQQAQIKSKFVCRHQNIFILSGRDNILNFYTSLKYYAKVILRTICQNSINIIRTL
jgi:hypothetical protein